ncbi:MAG: M3 family metallopeptidase [Deltaproteobacteria bacterium]|nr:M3 family metallopeptidase [Deltaproteobacteria bacterium]
MLKLPFEIPFDRIEAAHVQPAIEALLTDARANIQAIADAEGPRTYANTLGALDDATAELELAMTVVGHLESVATTQPLREAYNAVKPEVSAFYAGIPLNPALYAALKAFAATDEAAALTGPRRRFLEKTLADFKRHGAELSDAGKARLEAISRELAEHTAKFAQNLLDSTAAWELLIEDEAKLAGLPESARAAAKQSAQEKGKSGFRFTLQAPSVIPVLTYLDDRGIRETIYKAYNARATEPERANPPLIHKIIELRREQASLLGFATFADLVLEDRMAKRGQTAREFVADLEARTRPAFEAENAALLAFAREVSGDAGLTLEPWDVGYWAEKQRQKLYDFDDEVLRPYFPLPKVLEGLFETAERLYGVRAVANPKMPTWHPTATAYDLLDASGAKLGAFYADLFPRDEKRGGAWMNGLISGVLKDGAQGPHLGLICGNVTPPVGDAPALLTHDEVETLFHEFGHLLHHMLSKVEVRSLAGTNVAWDFVELPSQIMENWCWEREALDLFGRHHETGAAIPEALFEKMKRARTYRAANAMMRQLGFAATDLALHVDYDPVKDGDVVAWSRAIMQRYAPAEYFDGYAFIAGFGHLFSSAVGYAAGYYSYKWAEVLDADAFTAFAKAGVFDRDVGERFRRNILEPGDGEDPAVLFERFMGRAPSLDALLERSGLAA